MKRFFCFLILIFGIVCVSNAQTEGFTWKFVGTTDNSWTTSGNWQVWDGTTYVVATTYPLASDFTVQTKVLVDSRTVQMSDKITLANLHLVVRNGGKAILYSNATIGTGVHLETDGVSASTISVRGGIDGGTTTTELTVTPGHTGAIAFQSLANLTLKFNMGQVENGVVLAAVGDNLTVNIAATLGASYKKTLIDRTILSVTTPVATTANFRVVATTGGITTITGGTATSKDNRPTVTEDEYSYNISFSSVTKTAVLSFITGVSTANVFLANEAALTPSGATFTDVVFTNLNSGALFRTDLLSVGWRKLLAENSADLDLSTFDGTGGLNLKTGKSGFLSVPICRNAETLNAGFETAPTGAVDGMAYTNSVVMPVKFTVSDTLPISSEELPVTLPAVLNDLDVAGYVDPDLIKIGSKTTVVVYGENKDFYLARMPLDADHNQYEPYKAYMINTGFSLNDYPAEMHEVKFVSVTFVLPDDFAYSSYQVQIRQLNADGTPAGDWTCISAKIGHAIKDNYWEFNERGPWLFGTDQCGDFESYTKLSGMAFSATDGWIGKMQLIQNDPDFASGVVVPPSEVPTMPQNFTDAGILLPDYTAWVKKFGLTAVASADLDDYLFNVRPNTNYELKITGIIVEKDGEAANARTLVTVTAKVVNADKTDATDYLFTSRNGIVGAAKTQDLTQAFGKALYYNTSPYTTLFDGNKVTIIVPYNGTEARDFIKVVLDGPNNVGTFTAN